MLKTIVFPLRCNVTAEFAAYPLVEIRPYFVPMYEWDVTNSHRNKEYRERHRVYANENNCTFCPFLHFSESSSYRVLD